MGVPATLGQLKTNVADLQVGDYIACRYTATSNTFGTFSELGTCTATEIPVTSSATPDGLFYFICVGYDHLGRKKLIADRNIQHSISWDTLNSAGIASGSGLPIDIDTITSHVFTIRLLTGGISSSDKDNEWDKYIVESDLNGTITPGDDNVWHWSNIYSWNSTTNSVSSSYDRVIRGYSSASSYGSTLSSEFNYLRGFRPVLLVESLFQNKYLLRDGTNIKTIVDGVLTDVGVAPVTEEMFNTNCFLSLLDLTDTLIRQMTSPELLFLGQNVSAAAMSTTAVPEPKLVLANDDIPLGSIESIDYFQLTANVSGGGVLRLIASPDSGVTWYTYNGTWQIIDKTDLTAVKNSGMSVATFNAIPSTDWNQLIATTKKIRFGYYLEIASTSDQCSTDELIGQFDMKGSWYKAKHGTDYDYEYIDDGTCKVYLTNSGDFKINY